MSRWQLFGKTTSLSQAHGRGPWQVLAQCEVPRCPLFGRDWGISGHAPDMAEPTRMTPS